LCALVSLMAAPARGAEVWLDVSKAADRKIVIALPPLAAQEGPDELSLRQTLENDLLIAGHFRLLPHGGPQLAQAEKDRGADPIDPAAWGAFGAELLLRVDAVRQGGRLNLRATLFDVGARVQLLAREDSDVLSEAPRLAHRLSDAVVRVLTGGPGLALTRIAATWSHGTSPKRVVVMDYDGRNQRPLSADGVLALYPAWFPDGTRVAYVTYRQGRPEIVAQNVTTGQVRSLAFFPGLNASPAISPDGRQLLLIARGGVEEDKLEGALDERGEDDAVPARGPIRGGRVIAHERHPPHPPAVRAEQVDLGAASLVGDEGDLGPVGGPDG